MPVSDAELDAYIARTTADANLDEDTADRHGETADQIAAQDH
jgi:hypothetical protein